MPALLTQSTSYETVVSVADSRLSNSNRTLTLSLPQEMIYSSALTSVRGFIIPPSYSALTEDGDGALKMFTITLPVGQSFTADPEAGEEDRVTVNYLVYTPETPVQVVPNPCPSTTLEQVNVPWIVRRRNQGVPDGQMGYTDVTLDVAAYCGRLREITGRDVPTDTTGQGELALHRLVLLFDIGNFLSNGMDVGESDLMVRGQDDGAGNVSELVGGERYEIVSVRRYDRTTQIDVKGLR